MRSAVPFADRSPRARGGVIVVAGSDGTGKSTLCDAIERDVFTDSPVLRVHHRPGLLRYSQGPKGPVTEPHRDPPYGPWKSFAKATYLWVDFVLGWLVRFRPFVRDGGWVIMERGWWDIVVDPRRYRLDSMVALYTLLGRFLPRPDVMVVLEAPVEVIQNRKAELPDAELERQMTAWRNLPRSVRRSFLDASLPPDELVRRVRREIDAHRGEGGESGLRGWVALPDASASRWLLPRAPRAVARAGVFVYHPVTVGGLLGWRCAQVFAFSGGFRLLRRSEIDGVIPVTVLAHVPRDHTLAVALANRPGRFVALVLAPDGTCRAALKIATDERGCRLLGKERESLESMARRLPPPLSAPRVLAYEEGLLSLEPVLWQPRTRPWRLEPEVCFALGRFFAGGHGASTAEHPAHGDFAPWNLLRTRTGWTLIDWEDAFVDASPFHDVFTYLVQAHTLLHRPTIKAFQEGLRGEGLVGASIRGFAEGAGVPERESRRFLVEYLERTFESLDRTAPGASAALASRRRLLNVFGS